MSNPYSSTRRTSSIPSAKANVKAIVKGPAIGLMVISLIAITLGLLGLAGDAFLVMSGAVDQLEAMNDGPFAEKTMIMVRTVWGIVLLITSSFVLFGSFKMLNLTSFTMARAAAVVAMIPLLGPCCVLGIPFGIWAFVVLAKPHVRNGFIG